MQHIWKLKNAGMKDIINEYDIPKPATTTIATLLKRMRDKGVIDYRVNGKSREYFALLEKSVYFKSHFRGLMKIFFGNSAASLASFFTSSSDLSTDELKSLREMMSYTILIVE